MDTLQVTETAYKEHHPEIFSNPFITIRFEETIFVHLLHFELNDFTLVEKYIDPY